MPGARGRGPNLRNPPPALRYVDSWYSATAPATAGILTSLMPLPCAQRARPSRPREKTTREISSAPPPAPAASAAASQTDEPENPQGLEKQARSGDAEDDRPGKEAAGSGERGAARRARLHRGKIVLGLTGPAFHGHSPASASPAPAPVSKRPSETTKRTAGPGVRHSTISVVCQVIR